MGEVETTAFASYRFFPRDPSRDAPFCVTLPVHTQRTTGGELRDTRLSCGARGEAFRTLGVGDFLCGAAARLSPGAARERVVSGG